MFNNYQPPIIGIVPHIVNGSILFFLRLQLWMYYLSRRICHCADGRASRMQRLGSFSHMPHWVHLPQIAGNMKWLSSSSLTTLFSVSAFLATSGESGAKGRRESSAGRSSADIPLSRNTHSRPPFLRRPRRDRTKSANLLSMSSKIEHRDRNTQYRKKKKNRCCSNFLCV